MMKTSILLEPEAGHYHYRAIAEQDGRFEAEKIQGKSPVISTGNESVDNFLASLDTVETLEITRLEFAEMERRFEQWWVAHAWGYEDTRCDAQKEKKDHDAALGALRAYYQSPIDKMESGLTILGNVTGVLPLLSLVRGIQGDNGLPPLLQHPLKTEFGIFMLPGIQVWRKKAGACLEGPQDNSDHQWMHNDLSTPWGRIFALKGRVYAFEERPIMGGDVIGRTPVIPRNAGELEIELAVGQTLKTFVAEIVKSPVTALSIFRAHARRKAESRANLSIPVRPTHS